jgi:hypothetical protein
MRRSLLVLSLVPLLAAAAVRAQPMPASPADIDRALEFLRTANVVASKEIGKGVTRSRKITLTDGTLTHAAQFQPVHEERYPTELDKRGADLRFKDYWGFNVAAFELARLLGWDTLVPPTVERRIDGQKGAVCWWVEEVQFDEEARAEAKVQAPDAVAWTREVQRLRVFSELTADTDRNQGNILITHDWRIVLIDFTRAFRMNTQLREPARVRQIEAQALERLRALTADEVAARVSPWLTGAEIRAVMARRDSLVKHFDKLIAERGETAVLLR